MSLHRVIYVSDAAGAAANSLLTLVDILGASDRNNRRDHITGVLIRHGGKFLQWVEGARVDLDRLMARIATDPRHERLTVLSDMPVIARTFPDWTMAQVDADPPIVEILAATLTPRDADQVERLILSAAGSRVHH
ncbi:BLUF domain-containing protein [Brevundimonas sp.]|uniref:BLUF domain-containing protein n=1 Tax=Brevundimonas sp. TaxID=1871086 RepID=UPI002AB83DB7|nr:BLUF domain-containing protein [Brevundimonas sp.]MDZ4363425.1 BLUF domain-containing protein [Brevundimonas sp.]